MEHLENDMDDLFQKAGELYPLKITESDWDAVAGKLQDENFGDLNAVPGLAGKITRNKRKWLLILIPLGLAGLIYSSKLIYQGRDSTSIKTVNVNEQKNSQLKTPATDNNAAGQEELLSKKPNEVSKTNAQTVDHGIVEDGSKNEMQLTKGNGHIHAALKMRLSARDIENSKTLGSTAGKANTNNNPLNKDSPSETESVHESPMPIPPPVSGKSEDATAKNNSAISETFKPVTQDSSLTKKKAAVDSKQSKGLYIGFVVGPDISSVDFQAIKNPGFSIGAIVGYRFNRRLAIETGLLWDKKYYYSDGAHYKSQPANGYTINDVDGNCSMYEIPLSLRYDFGSGENHGYFAKAGFSSYLMRNQNYSANKEYNGTSTPVTWANNNSYNYFFSVVQLSGGYEFSIGGKTKISIEPYVKIPLKGMGQGSMPISSAGIYFGIIHSFR